MTSTRTVRFRVYGIVQGVGFRPTVDRHASTAGIRGTVCNKGPYVEIFAQGTPEQIKCFETLLNEQPPRRAAILKIDEKARVVYFVGNGKETDENPYYEHLYRVNLDGSGLKQLTEKDFFHSVHVDDDARFIVDNYSRVNTVPMAVLLDNNGKKVMDIQESDFSQLFANGYKFPEVFKVKAADGITDLY